MNTLSASLLAWAWATAGMAALAFAMDRHHEQLTGAREISRRRSAVLRAVGVCGLAAAAVPCLQAWGGSVGTVAWLGWLSAGALGAVAGLGIAPRGLAYGASALALLAPLAWVVCGGLAA